MAQDVSRTLLSYDDYAAIDDGRRYQVIEGELVRTPSPGRTHQQAVPLIWQALQAHIQATDAGRVFIAPFDVVLRADRPAVVVQPDVVFVAHHGAAVVTEANIQGPPDLVAEVASPSSTRIDAITKRRLYARYGVPEYWLVSLDAEQIAVHLADEAGHYGKPSLYEPGDRLTTPRLPGFALDVAAFFAGASRS